MNWVFKWLDSVNTGGFLRLFEFCSHTYTHTYIYTYRNWRRSQKSSYNVSENKTKTHTRSHKNAHMHTYVCIYTHTQRLPLNFHNASISINSYLKVFNVHKHILATHIRTQKNKTKNRIWKTIKVKSEKKRVGGKKQESCRQRDRGDTTLYRKLGENQTDFWFPQMQSCENHTSQFSFFHSPPSLSLSFSFREEYGNLFVAIHVLDRKV